MSRRAQASGIALVASILVALASSPSRADRRRSCEPSRFGLFGEDSYFTVGETPDHVFFDVEGRSSSPMTIELVRLRLVDGDHERRVAIRSVVDDATGDTFARSISLSRDARRRLRVHVDVSEHRRSYTFRATFADGSCRYDADSTVVYAHRTPVPGR